MSKKFHSLALTKENLSLLVCHVTLPVAGFFCTKTLFAVTAPLDAALNRSLSATSAAGVAAAFAFAVLGAVPVVFAALMARKASKIKFRGDDISKPPESLWPSLQEEVTMHKYTARYYAGFLFGSAAGMLGHFSNLPTVSTIPVVPTVTQQQQQLVPQRSLQPVTIERRLDGQGRAYINTPAKRALAAG